MSYSDPNQQGQYPNSGQHSGYNPNPQPTDPYSGQQYGGYQQQPGQQGGYQQQPGYQQPPEGTNYGQSGQQQYGQQQGGYQQPYGQQQNPYGQQQNPYGGGSQLGPSTMNMDPNVAAGLSYILGWVTGLIFFLLEKQNRFVRFNAMQSIILSGTLTVISILSNILYAILPSGLDTAVSCVSGLISLAGFIVIIVCLVNAFQGKYFKLPVIGDYAERYANQGRF